MKYIYKVFCGFLSLCMIYAMTACNASNKPSADAKTITERIAEIDLEETYQSAPVSLAIVYDDVPTIVSDADVIIKGSVTSQKVVELDGYPQTHTTMTVTTVLKGDIEVGSSINIIEEGGYDGKLICGIPQLSSENDYYLMLIEYEEAYYVCGAFQGRFVEREGYVFQQATEDVKLTRTYAPMTAEEFEAMVTGDIEG